MSRPTPPHRQHAKLLQTNRRGFLQATSAALAAPTIIAATALGAENKPAASERLTVGMIGCGKMANSYHLPELLKAKDVEIVAVCEVDKSRREHAMKRVADAYAKQSLNNVCQQYDDFRKVINREDIDAVCIATPDHWHATPIIEACKAGKDVYCEKPLTLTIAEAQRCVQAARKYERIVQTGSQQRSSVFGPFRHAVEIIRSGRLGKIHQVTVGVGDPSVPCNLSAEEMEPGLNWDMWLGQAPLRDYNSILSPRGVHSHFPAWRNYQEYSGGGHTDMGAHHYDIAQWAMDMDASGPIKIVPPADSAARRGVKYIFADGAEMVHGGPGGCTFHGDRGTLRIDRGHLSSDPEEIVKEPLGENDVHLPKSPGHHRNWLDCIKSRERPVADVEAGARTVTIIHLGNLAYREHRELAWDPDKWVFGDENDNRLLDRERRDPWQLPNV